MKKISNVGNFYSILMAKREQDKLRDKLVRSNQSGDYDIYLDDSRVDGQDRYRLWLVKY